MISPRYVMEMFVVSQCEDGVFEGVNLAGPFEKLDVALACMGHDNDTYIVQIGLKETPVYRWNDVECKWEQLVEIKKERIGRDVLMEPIYDGYYSIAEHLPLSETLVEGAGVSNPRLMIVGDYPEDCDRELIYTGEQGEILKRALLDAGYTKYDVYMTTLVKHALFSDSDKLNYEEARKFVPLLFREIEIVQPARVMLLGLFCASAVLGNDKLTQKIAVVTTYNFTNAPARKFRVGYHPKFVARAGGVLSGAYRAYVKQFKLARQKSI